MNIEDLWGILNPQQERIEIIKKDLSEGKVPELPYFIVDQDNAKDSVGSKLASIDGDRMQTNLIIARYGNGKTNLLKYLSLYFQERSRLGVYVIYSRADIDQTDIFLFLLQSIQYNFINQLIEFVKRYRIESPVTIESFANNFNDNFSAIREYGLKLFDSQNEDETIKEILLLGTGRLYSKGNFSKYGLEQLTNFNRREILVLFLNILSKGNIYLIFAIDELEKIHEKSAKRLNHFLTSYRELIDLSNKIRGHYLITCFTDATSSQELRSSNEAFYSRIERDIIRLESITRKDDIKELTNALNTLLQTNKSQKDVSSIVSDVVKKASELDTNRRKIQYIAHRLSANTIDFIDLESYFSNNNNLHLLYKETLERLNMEDAFKNINRAFFSPLEYYLEALNFQEVDDNLVRTAQIFIDKLDEKIHFFLFNENLTLNNELNERISDLMLKHEIDKFIIYAPYEIELSNSQLNVYKCDVDIIDYNPKEMFTLFVMFRENCEKQTEIADIIHLYSKSNL